MGILSQYQLRQTHTDTRWDLKTFAASDKAKNRWAEVREMTWQLTLVFLIG